MVRLDNPNMTFYHISKNAGTSIEDWFLKNIKGAEIYNGDMRHAYPLDIYTLWDDLGWCFACVRNPWDRTFSWYNYQKKGGKMSCSFEEFVMKLFYEGDLTKKYYRPVERQINWSTCDYLIRYENLIEDFKVVQKKLNCFEPLPHLNLSQTMNNYADHYINDRMINIVGEYFKEDIDYFDYSFDSRENKSYKYS
jgi:hypothetical protein